MNKKTLLLLIPLIILISSSCMRREYVIEYDYDYRGNFKKYNSFYFMHNAKVNQDSSQNAFNPLLEEAIQNRMEILGYKFSKEKPRLLVAYTIYYDDMKFRGYVQPELEKWIEKEISDDKYNELIKTAKQINPENIGKIKNNNIESSGCVSKNTLEN